MSARRRGFLRRHSLSLIVSAILLFLLVMYWRSDDTTHLGQFYGNAIADWFGTLVFIVATKYFFEVGSRESRKPHMKPHEQVLRFTMRHSLSIVLAMTGVMWAMAYARSDVNGKTGQVIGNIVSEWTQILGLVLITKYARETGSKE
jgi:cobalamin synthase